MSVVKGIQSLNGSFLRISVFFSLQFSRCNLKHLWSTVCLHLASSHRTKSRCSSMLIQLQERLYPISLPLIFPFHLRAELRCGPYEIGRPFKALTCHQQWSIVRGEIKKERCFITWLPVVFYRLTLASCALWYERSKDQVQQHSCWTSGIMNHRRRGSNIEICQL